MPRVKLRRMAAVAVMSLVAAACTGDGATDEVATTGPNPPSETTTTSAGDTTTTVAATQPAPTGRYRATIRRTSHNIPHIVADDFGGLGFGQGYAFAEDHLCTLADRVVRANGELASHHGRGEGDAHLNNDVMVRHLDLTGLAADDFAVLAPEHQDLVAGYAAGYNTYLAETGVDAVPGWCRGAEWVRPIDEIDLMAVYKQLLLLASSDSLVDLIATAQPPVGGSAAPAPDPAPPAAVQLGSNGWGLGADVTDNGRGIMLINPHFPWEGALRLWESHLTIPGELNVYGASLLGVPGVLIGFNEAVAWMMPVSAGHRLTGYTLTLDPADPTAYLYDGERRPMTSKEVTVEVLDSEPITRTMYASHYGPIINFPGLGWSDALTITYRDANIDNQAFLAQFIALNQAESMAEFQQAHQEHLGIPWVNTVSVSAEGEAWYIDATPTPNLSDEALALWRERLETDFFTSIAFDNGFVLLDGSDSTFEWQDEPGARNTGLVPWERLPQLARSDWVFNSNDSYWLTNPAEPLTGFSPMHGPAGTVRSTRTRQNLAALTDDSPTGPRGEDGLWSFDEVKAAAVDNRSFTASLLLDELLAACVAAPEVDLSNTTVDLTKACEVLAGWDRTFNLEAAGAVLFREWIDRYELSQLREPGPLLAGEFDPADPAATPRGLANPGLARRNLALAMLVLEEAGLALDVTLGELQYSDRAGPRIPIHGGTEWEGVTNKVNPSVQDTTTEPTYAGGAETVGDSRAMTGDGYPVAFGASFFMVVAFTDDGPVAEGFLTYGQSGDPESEYFSDQTALFSDKSWRPARFTEADIAADLVAEYEVGGAGN